MTQPAAVQRVSYAEYLAAEEASDVRHEYLRGEVFAMAGGTPEHSALAMSFGAALVAALRGRPCTVFGSDLRVRVPETDLAIYPDVAVVCGSIERDAVDPHAVVNPVLLAEILSDSTEAHDRGETFAHYRRITSLREVVLVSQHEARIEVYRRNDAGRWELYEARAGERAELASVGCTVDVDEVYRDPLPR